MIFIDDAARGANLPAAPPDEELKRNEGANMSSKAGELRTAIANLRASISDHGAAHRKLERERERLEVEIDGLYDRLQAAHQERDEEKAALAECHREKLLIITKLEKALEWGQAMERERDAFCRQVAHEAYESGWKARDGHSKDPVQHADFNVAAVLARLGVKP